MAANLATLLFRLSGLYDRLIGIVIYYSWETFHAVRYEYREADRNAVYYFTKFKHHCGDQIKNATDEAACTNYHFLMYPKPVKVTGVVFEKCLDSLTPIYDRGVVPILRASGLADAPKPPSPTPKAVETVDSGLA